MASLPNLVDVYTGLTGNVRGPKRIAGLMCSLYPSMGKYRGAPEGSALMWTHVLVTNAGVDLRAPNGQYFGIGASTASDWIECPIGSGQYYSGVLVTRPYFQQPGEYTKLYLWQLSLFYGAGVKWLGP